MDAWFPVLTLVMGIGINEVLTLLRERRRGRAEAKERQRVSIRELLDAAHVAGTAALAARAAHSQQPIAALGVGAFTSEHASMDAAAIKLRSAAVWVDDSDLRKSAFVAAAAVEEGEDDLMDRIQEVIVQADLALRKLA